MASISVITPTTRPDLLPILEKCLKRQDFQDFEWIITAPEKAYGSIQFEMGIGLVNREYPLTLLKDPPKTEGDFYSLNKGWNKAWANANGELIVNIQDGLWFPPDTLSKFWFNYQQKPKGLFSAIGHQYEGFDEYGKPLTKMWHDPRSKTEITFEEVPPSEIEFCMSSVPKQALIECGGLDEAYDVGPAVAEKEMCWRLNKLNWDFYIDHTIEYRAIHHPRLTGNWDKLYTDVITPLFIKHMGELQAGSRPLNVDNILKYKL